MILCSQNMAAIASYLVGLMERWDIDIGEYQEIVILPAHVHSSQQQTLSLKHGKKWSTTPKVLLWTPHIHIHSVTPPHPIPTFTHTSIIKKCLVTLTITSTPTHKFAGTHIHAHTLQLAFRNIPFTCMLTTTHTLTHTMIFKDSSSWEENRKWF